MPTGTKPHGYREDHLTVNIGTVLCGDGRINVPERQKGQD
jgi:hypothetical protein